MSNKSTEDTNKKSYQTRLKIIDAYIDLVKVKDFDTITVKAIAEKAQITRGTFYLYFTDIYELVTYIENTLLADMPNTPSPRTFQRDKLSLPSYEMCRDNTWERSWFAFYDAHSDYLNALLGPHGDSSFATKIKKNLQNALRIRMQQDGLRNDEFQNYFIELIPNLYLLLAKEWTSSDTEQPMDVDAMIQIISTIRVGSLYLDSLETRIALGKSTEQEKF